MTYVAQGDRSCASIRSPVYWTLLGLLIERPDYGNGLAQRYEREFGDALPISSNSHVYEGLNVLQDAGLIEDYMSKGGRRRQPKPHYRATPEGMHAYKDWLMARVPLERLRPRLFARQLAALATEPQLGLEVIEHYERACLQESRVAGTMHAGVDPSSGEIGALAAALPAEQARLASEAELPWAQYARARFTKLLRARMSSDGAA